MTHIHNKERSVFENIIQALESEIANVGVHLTIDSEARKAYARQIREMANKLRNEAINSTLSDLTVTH